MKNGNGCLGSGFVFRLAALVVFVGSMWLSGSDPKASGKAGEWESCLARKDVVRKFTSVKTMRCRYREEKRLELLSRPLVSKGRMYYLKPDKVRQDMTEPARQSVTIVGDRIEIVNHDMDKRQVMDLSGSKAAQLVVRSVLEIVSGRAAGLNKKYQCRLRSFDGGWKIALKPMDEKLAKLISFVQVTLDQDLVLKKVVIKEKNGDQSTMTFQDVVYDREFSEEELHSLFGQK